MARILVLTSGLTGVTLAAIEACRRLAADGHDAILASPTDVADLAGERGVPFTRLAPIAWDPAPQIEGGGRVGRKLHEFRTRSERRREGVRRLGMEAFIEAVRDLRPDLALVDLELDEHAIALGHLGVRTAMLSPWFEHLKRPGLPPLQSSAVPGRGPRGTRAGLEFEWAKARARRIAQLLRVWSRYFGTDRRSVVREYARGVGAPAERLGRLDGLGLLSHGGAPTLSMTASELEFPHDARPERQHVGPMVDAGSEPDSDAVRHVERLARSAKERGGALVYAGVSTRNAEAGGVLSALARACARSGRHGLLIGAGGRPDVAARLRAELDRVPGVTVLDWAPQFAAIRAAEVAVNHGGVHAIHEALLAGTPQVVVSEGVVDQDGCAARVSYHGAGVVVDRRRASDQALEDALALALSSRTGHLHELSRAVARYRTDRVLERVVTSLLGQPG